MEGDIISDESPAIVNNNSTALATPELVNEWYDQNINEKHSFSSTNTYWSFIKRYVGYGILINKKTVNKYMGNNMSNVASGSLKSFFRFLVNKKDFPEEILNIKFDRIKTTRKAPEYFDNIEVGKIINAIEPIKLKLLTMVLAECGLRISEGVKLKWENFNWSKWITEKNNMGSMTLKHTKGNKFRTIPVSSSLMNELYNYHQNKTTDGIPIGNLVFDFGIIRYIDVKLNKEDNANNMYNYIVYATDHYRQFLHKITKHLIGRRAHPHMFRHYAAQSLMDKGLPLIHLKEFLGHSNIGTTEIYAHSSAEVLKKEMEKLNGK